MNRPYIVCHMLSALDGKITGPFMDCSIMNPINEEYERINESYHPQAWLCGRVTTDENFTFYRKPELEEITTNVVEGDYIALDSADMYYVSVDPSGKIGWTTNTLQYAHRPEAHIIEVITEKVSHAYRSYLRNHQISYIIAGEKELDCQVASMKLKELFHIETLMVSGGGVINWSFLQAGLIDELSLVLAPITDGETKTATLFKKSNHGMNGVPIEFALKGLKD